MLTPGPLTTTDTVKEAMMSDWCTWDEDYNVGVVERIRQQLVELAASRPDEYTAVLMQGSGTFCVEATLGSAVKPTDKLLEHMREPFARGIIDAGSADEDEPLLAAADMNAAMEEYIADYIQKGILTDHGDVYATLDSIMELGVPEDPIDKFAYAYGYVSYLYEGND